MSVRGYFLIILSAAAILLISWYVPLMMKTTKQPIERAEIQGLILAVKGYQTEYSKLPELGTTDESKYVESAGPLIEALTGQHQHLNPKKIPFYEPPARHPLQGTSGKGTIPTPTTSTDIRDPKGNRYRVHFDWDGDGIISNPKEPGTKISNSVIVYSAGPDGDYTTWHDNVTSWED